MAFTDSGPEIVLLGRKSRDDEETRNLFELLQQVRPDCVPREVLHSLFLTSRGRQTNQNQHRAR